MRIDVIAIGRLREKHYRQAADEYLRRLTGYAQCQEVELRGGGRGEVDVIKRQEGDRLLEAIPPGAFAVVLDERGASMTSVELSRSIAERALYGRPHTVFVIGGADGLDPRLIARADAVLSLSKMTLPHELARVLLWEQVYRAMTIARGEPYHK